MFEQAFKKIDDILRKDAGVSSELDYIEQTSWLLFLKYLDALEQDRAQIAELHVSTGKTLPLAFMGHAPQCKRYS
ncbi:type I restriction-modification system subunit M N-terminal domain-containing protein [Acidobacterium sp. S8]|uniref:type I restriction-modification system subunit M N-terminal domain-containing protein n=1 Tax=Acidobacterium sp. S8 TaxID=1641854 RepID=UPI001C204EFE|nr:type I restriction-modification system subunit M N-terminal domain-containing protein [Acidobacterium sp. S8]